MFRHLLIATNGSSLSTTAVRTGVALARMAGAHVTVATCSRPFDAAVMDPLLDIRREEYESAMAATAAKRLANARAIAQEAGLRAATDHVIAEQPYQGLLDAARSKGCDLIVMASRGHRPIAGLFVGSQTLKLLTHSTRPVLVCPPAESCAFTHFLAPTDGSDLSTRSMRAAIDLATFAKARVTLLTCTTPALAAATADIRGTYMDVAETTARSRLQAGEHYAESRRTRVDSEHSFTRHPYQAINACAEALACDLIVMASHGKRGPIAMLLGSETLKVLTNAKVPVLVWR